MSHKSIAKQLLIDIGNTRTKYCFVINGELQPVSYCDNQGLSAQWFSQHWLDVEQIVFASVAQQGFSSLLTQWAEQNRIPCLQVTSPVQAFGVVNGYDNHRQLGVDRWLAVLGAHKRFPNQNCIIVDAGTATTIDYLDRAGQHQGGWILAGIETLFTSIQANTANVQGEQLDIEKLAFGQNTNDNLAQAAWASTLGLIQQAIQLAEQQGASIDQVFLTGGNGQQLAEMLAAQHIPTSYLPLLVFEGLSCYLTDSE
ncbi:type III pantothenate kinase [Thalassotalea euphylliae]|uniref:Type III pantothenate kinase n=1 Tax=Thalassotalea euphylliae TaxID=1655234 RepID=A0A3E0UB92_9GAMM|nr:type III pantothenate kinase [Thalassotalea euphylliae]REL34100.1 type III pantothenate kinase [Thalassotalea euphylliae]